MTPVVCKHCIQHVILWLWINLWAFVSFHNNSLRNPMSTLQHGTGYVLLCNLLRNSLSLSSLPLHFMLPALSESESVTPTEMEMCHNRKEVMSECVSFISHALGMFLIISFKNITELIFMNSPPSSKLLICLYLPL